MFINLSNHPSDRWSKEQIRCALEYGSITDIPFPVIPEDISDSKMDSIVTEYADRITDYSPSAVMVQGEAVFTFRIVTLLKARGIRVVAAYSKRESICRPLPDGSTVRESTFRFERFLNY